MFVIRPFYPSRGISTHNRFSYSRIDASFKWSPIISADTGCYARPSLPRSGEGQWTAGVPTPRRRPLGRRWAVGGGWAKLRLNPQPLPAPASPPQTVRHQVLTGAPVPGAEKAGDRRAKMHARRSNPARARPAVCRERPPAPRRRTVPLAEGRVKSQTPDVNWGGGDPQRELLWVCFKIKMVNKKHLKFIRLERV